VAQGSQRMISHFYGYELRSTDAFDVATLCQWSPACDAMFWLKQGGGIQSFMVADELDHLGVFQTEHVKADQVRLHFQANPWSSPKKVLLAITRLVPLIEQALCLRGVKTIFFTSHSLKMARFMQERLGYLTKLSFNTPDGQVMYKHIAEARPSAVASPQEPDVSLGGQLAEAGLN
jgi:hypothetical protein